MPIPSCYVCKTSATELGQTLYACSMCKSRSYCSKECQRQDWRAGGHKKECSRLKILREQLWEADELEIGDPLPPDFVKRINEDVRRFRKTGFEFDYWYCKDTRFQAWLEHTEEILARDPSSWTKTVTVRVSILDFSIISDTVARESTIIIKPFLAGLLSLHSRPQGEWAFCQYLNRSLDKEIWKVGPWLCFECQSPATRCTSMAAKFLFHAEEEAEEDMRMSIYRVPVCFECMSAATHHLPAINAKLWSFAEELK
jgi:hypothetical protein